MNRNHFEDKYRQANIHQEEIERKWRIHQEEILREQMMMFEAARAASSAAVASGAGGGYLTSKPLCENPSLLAGVIDWDTYAPGGFGLPDSGEFPALYNDFDSWTTENFTAVTDVTRLSISSSYASAHIHDFEYSDLTIDLYDSTTRSWVTVWTYRLENPNYPAEWSDDFFVNGLDVTFPTISQVTAIRMTSNPGMDQSYHSWGYNGFDGLSPVQFNLYQCGNKTSTLKLVWNDIKNTPVADPTSVSDWNDFFSDTFFSAVEVTGNIVNLTPIGDVTIHVHQFSSPSKEGNLNLLQIIDDANCIVGVRDMAFAHCRNLTTAILPVCAYIGSLTFELCDNLVTVDFSSVEEVDFMGLGDLRSLKSLNMPSLITAGDYTFYGNNKMTSFIAPNMEAIGDYGFAYCYDLVELEIPSCTNLGSSTINNNVFEDIGLGGDKNNITMTIDPSRMTCNSGMPDGDIMSLAQQIEPSILTVN